MTKVKLKDVPKIQFQPLEPSYYPEWGFRPKTRCIPMDMNFIFLNGGMGDYVTWLRPIQWLASQATWINGILVGPKYLTEIAQYILKPYPKWGYLTYDELKGKPHIEQRPFRGPINLQTESLNATGAHLITCGWVYFTNKEKAPQGIAPDGRPWDSYPLLDQDTLDQIELPEGCPTDLHKYAVMPMGVTTDSRRIPGHYWNPVIEHVLSKGLTPLFLGKSLVETGNARNIHASFDSRIRFDLGVDLRDKTTLMQCAAIMSKSKLVIGHDNGLLHLAGMTNVPIVFSYNLASPEHREPRRPVGKVYNVHLDEGELACNFCQSKTNFVIAYNFRQCFYSDNKCLDLLFKDDGQRFKDAIDKALGETGCPTTASEIPER